jgi:hypothetical protein
LEAAGKLKEQPQFQPWLTNQVAEQAFCADAVKAVADLKFALRKPMPHAGQLARARAAVLAGAGKHTAAAETAERLREKGPTHPMVLFDVACCYALCINGVPSNEQALRQRYQDQAIAALDDAVKNGFKDSGQLAEEYDLAPVRTAKGYQELEKRLQAMR